MGCGGIKHNNSKMADSSYKEKFPAAFPLLTPAQMRDVGKAAHCHTYHDGDVMMRTGDTEFKFYVVQKGEIDILDRSGDVPKILLTHGPGEFTGDSANFSGRAAHVDAVAKGTVEVYEICSAELRTIISEQPVLSDIILKAFIARDVALSESDFMGIRVIGSQYSPDTFRIRDFLAKNLVLFTWVDADHDAGAGALLAHFGVGIKDTPIVAYGTEWLLRNPSNTQLAERIGMKHTYTAALYDLVIAGAGPAGLAAAVYGASEGLNTMVLEMLAPGGQAGTSSRIENYLGFPTGVSGTELAARATMQAEKFGARLNVPSKIVRMYAAQNHHVLELESGETFAAKAVIIASGAEYKKLEAKNLELYEGRGIYYAATKMEAMICAGEPVCVVGGGNSAGQAAIFLSEQVRKVYLIIRGAELAITMSKYLEQRIHESANIELLNFTEITEITGDGHVESIMISNRKTNDAQQLSVAAVFSFIGAVPRTAWLPEEIERDERGFVKTGADAGKSARWTAARSPYLLETTCPGVFAVGDVRSNSVKRVASAVGEGSMAVQFVHEYLKG